MAFAAQEPCAPRSEPALTACNPVHIIELSIFEPAAPVSSMTRAAQRVHSFDTRAGYCAQMRCASI
jgi:hypothetical protein